MEYIESASFPKKKEGWTYLYNSSKWHFFIAGRSLCGRFMLLLDPIEGYETGNETSKDNCAARRRKREKQIAKLEAAKG